MAFGDSSEAQRNLISTNLRTKSGSPEKRAVTSRLVFGPPVQAESDLAVVGALGHQHEDLGTKDLRSLGAVRLHFFGEARPTEGHA